MVSILTWTWHKAGFHTGMRNIAGWAYDVPSIVVRNSNDWTSVVPEVEGRHL